MSRQKTNPITRAFDAFVALDFDQRQQLDAMIAGFKRATYKPAPKPERKPREKKALETDKAVG